MSDAMRALFSVVSRGPAGRRAGRRAAWRAGGVLLGLGLVLHGAPVRADSQWAEGRAAQALVARAHLDFRITVLPSLALRPAADGLDAVATLPALMMGVDAEGRIWQRAIGPGRVITGTGTGTGIASARAGAVPRGAMLTLVTP